MLFLLQITWYGPVTHAYISAKYPLLKLLAQILIWCHLRSQGSKGHFHQIWFFFYRLHCIVLWLMYIHQLDTPYKFISSNLNLGSLGSKGHFHQKCYNSSILHSMTIRLMHVHKLNTLYLYYGVKGQPGVIWGNRGQEVIFTKNALSCSYYIAWPQNWYMCISLRPSTYFVGSKVNLGSFGVTGVKKFIFAWNAIISLYKVAWP